LDSEHSRGLRQITVAVAQDTLDVFPFDASERLRRDRYAISALERLPKVHGRPCPPVLQVLS
jgi:hypothetical protein